MKFWSEMSENNVSISTTASISSPADDLMIALSNPNLSKYIHSIRKNFFIFCDVYSLINLITLILITMQLKYIFKSFNRDDFFNPKHAQRIRAIAVIIFMWVIFDYLLRFTPVMFISHYCNCIYSNIGINSFRDCFTYGIMGFNLKLLLVSIIIYVLSFVFKHGSKLQEESVTCRNKLDL